MFEYICPDCDVDELSLEVLPKKKCPHCKNMMEVIEWEGSE